MSHCVRRVATASPPGPRTATLLRAVLPFALRAFAVSFVVLSFLIAAAVTASPASAAEDGLGRFRTQCGHSHFAQVDPIVNPGPSGTPSHHLHEFAANTSTDSSSTYSAMVVAETNCDLSADTAAYWTPALIGPGDQRVEMEKMTAYYSNRPVMASGQATIAFPPDFRMIAPAIYPHSYWNCVGDSDHTMESRHATPPDCGDRDLRLHVFFPSCWDGRLDSPNHKSHVAYGYRDGSVYGSPGATEDYRIDACPSTHPLKIPQVRYRIVYPVSNGSQYSLADGTQLAHADFWNTWDQDVLEALTDQVLNAQVVTPDIHDGNLGDFLSLIDSAEGGERVGLVDPTQGLWHLRHQGGAVESFYYGVPGDFPFVGDWNCDGVDTPGLYRQSDGFVYLRNSNTQGIADIRFFFGNPGDIPLAGDFDGDGCDTVSIYRPGESRIYVINELGSNDGGLGAADYSYLFGNPGDKPFVGDFDGDGIDTVGLHRESTGLVYFRNSNTQGIAHHQYFFGDPGDRLVAGDWGIVDGDDTPAVFRPSNAVFYFRFTNTQGNADDRITFGSSHHLPVAGQWKK